MKRYPLACVVAGPFLLAACGGSPAPAATVTVTAAATSTTPAGASGDPGEAAGGVPSGASINAANGVAEVEPGKPVEFGAGLSATARWGEWDAAESCQHVDVEVANRGTTDAIFATTPAEASNAQPLPRFTMTAGDTLADVQHKTLGGATLWPRRLRAGATETVTTCWESPQSEQHLTLSMVGGDGGQSPVGGWAKK